MGTHLLCSIFFAIRAAAVMVSSKKTGAVNRHDISTAWVPSPNSFTPSIGAIMHHASAQGAVRDPALDRGSPIKGLIRVHGVETAADSGKKSHVCFHNGYGEAGLMADRQRMIMFSPPKVHLFRSREGHFPVGLGRRLSTNAVILFTASRAEMTLPRASHK